MTLKNFITDLFKPYEVLRSEAVTAALKAHPLTEREPNRYKSQAWDKLVSLLGTIRRREIYDLQFAAREELAQAGADLAQTLRRGAINVQALYEMDKNDDDTIVLEKYPLVAETFPATILTLGFNRAVNERRQSEYWQRDYDAIIAGSPPELFRALHDKWHPRPSNVILMSAHRNKIQR